MANYYLILKINEDRLSYTHDRIIKKYDRSRSNHIEKEWPFSTKMANYYIILKINEDRLSKRRIYTIVL